MDAEAATMKESLVSREEGRKWISIDLSMGGCQRIHNGTKADSPSYKSSFLPIYAIRSLQQALKSRSRLRFDAAYCRPVPGLLQSAVDLVRDRLAPFVAGVGTRYLNCNMAEP